ncbi:unnamed protein product [Lymnaea stagnalis]|uniref:Uncharacterized protein n=1 Tax=Lymnaea stagnalis TaxID=6523 RepID=A0AAV2I4W6_LYMST
MTAAIKPRTMKMALVGDINVGKTSLARMFIDGTFQARYQASVGLHFHTKTLRDPSVTIQLWDTAGTERYRSLLPHYTRDAVCAVLVYDISSRDSFDNVRSYWLDFVESHAIPNMVKFLVGNKADVDTREVSDYEAQMFATNHDTFFMETSAKFGTNVDNLFTEAAKAVIKAIPETQFENGGIRLEDLHRKHDRRCCLAHA